MLQVASATAGISGTVSTNGTITGTSSTTATITAGPITLQACTGVTWTVIGDYKTGDWSGSAYMKGYYYPDPPGNSPLLTVTCNTATGNVTGSDKYFYPSGSMGAVWDCDDCE